MVISSDLVPDISQPSTSAHLLDRRSLEPEHTDIVTEVPIDSFGATTSTGGKQKLPLPDIAEDRPTKARTLGGDRIRDKPNIVKEICLPVDQRVVVSGTSEIESKNILAAPPILTYMSLKVADAGDDIMECRNDESGGKVGLLCYLDPIDHPHMGSISPNRDHLYQRKNCVLA
jgi:hypothetical protein